MSEAIAIEDIIIDPEFKYLLPPLDLISFAILDDILERKKYRELSNSSKQKTG